MRGKLREEEKEFVRSLLKNLEMIFKCYGVSVTELSYASGVEPKVTKKYIKGTLKPEEFDILVFRRLCKGLDAQVKVRLRLKQFNKCRKELGEYL